MARPLPKVLESEDQSALLDQFNTRYDTNLRNLVLVRLMLDGGLRVSEAVSVRLQDVRLDSGRVGVKDGKGGRDRVAWLRDREAFREVAADWLERRPESDWFAPTRYGTRVKTSYMRAMVKRKARQAGIQGWEEVSPHTLRHSYATDLLRDCGCLETVRKALGHADIQTTLIYAHLTNEDVERAVQSMTREAA